MTYLVSGTSKVIAMILKDEEIINKIAKERLAVVKIAAKMFLQQQLDEAQEAKKKLSQIRKGRVTDAKVVNDLMSYIGDIIPKAQAYEKRLKEIKQKREERRLKKEQKHNKDNEDGEQQKDSQNAQNKQPEQQQQQEEEQPQEKQPQEEQSNQEEVPQVNQEEVPQMKINEEQQQQSEDKQQQNHDLDSQNNDSEGNQTNGKLSLTEGEKEYDLESLKSNSSYSTIHFLNDAEQESLYSRYTSIKNCADIALKQYSEAMPQGLLPLIEFNYQLKTVYKPSKTDLTPEQQVTEKLNALTTIAANTSTDNIFHNTEEATLQFYDKQGKLLDSIITFDNIKTDIKRATLKRQEAIKDIADKLKKLKRTAKKEKNPSLQQATTDEIDSIKKIKEGILKGGVYKIFDSE
jgi:hypothetical protein